MVCKRTHGLQTNSWFANELMVCKRTTMRKTKRAPATVGPRGRERHRKPNRRREPSRRRHLRRCCRAGHAELHLPNERSPFPAQRARAPARHTNHPSPAPHRALARPAPLPGPGVPDAGRRKAGNLRPGFVPRVLADAPSDARNWRKTMASRRSHSRCLWPQLYPLALPLTLPLTPTPERPEFSTVERPGRRSKSRSTDTSTLTPAFFLTAACSGAPWSTPRVSPAPAAYQRSSRDP
jgi:hypothetical protein